MSESLPPTSDAQLLALLERAFAHHAGAAASIGQKDLQRALGLRSDYLAAQVFRCFDANGDGAVSRDEFLAAVRSLVFGSDRDKLLFAFRLHDGDGDGAIGRDELLRMISISLAESDIRERLTQPSEELTDALFRVADRNHDNRISFDELETVIRDRPELLKKMTRNEAIWIAPNEDLVSWLDERRAGTAGGARARSALPIVVLALFAIANAAILVTGLHLGVSRSLSAWAMQSSRALATCVDFDGALILLPMMRGLLTRLRPTWLGRFAPLDDAIDFHRIVGHTLFAMAVGHAGASAFAYSLGHTSDSVIRVFGTARGLTGGALLIVFAVMWVTALAFVRRKQSFELFYFTHLLYVVWFGLAVAHAPSFLFWAGVPILGFLIEQLLRLRRRARASAVLASEALRSGVTRLEVARPSGFRFGPGDYAFIRIPQIARHEWHPFTISSAPERDTLSFHIRSLGNWTAALRALAERPEGASFLAIHIDGPYGSPSAHIFASRYAVLIGAGIGVTPFASVLESMVLRANGETSKRAALKKAHFIWLNRDQYSFEWFVALLQQLEATDTSGCLDVQLYMTGARGGVTSIGLELAREVMQAAGAKDIVTGLQTRTHLGPPDWDSLLGAIAQQHAPDKVDVYFCGPPGLGTKVRASCAKLNMSFREEVF